VSSYQSWFRIGDYDESFVSVTIIIIIIIIIVLLNYYYCYYSWTYAVLCL
jgi:hypothetical protein